jgi:UrcA family protein
MSAMRRYMNFKTAIPCSLLAILIGSLSACADAIARSDEVPSRRVSFADLDLTRSVEAAILYSRIKSAAGEVCEPVVVGRPLASLAGTHQCVAESIARAVADVNAPALTSYHLAKTGHAIRLAQQR